MMLTKLVFAALCLTFVSAVHEVEEGTWISGDPKDPTYLKKLNKYFDDKVQHVGDENARDMARWFDHIESVEYLEMEDQTHYRIIYSKKLDNSKCFADFVTFKTGDLKDTAYERNQLVCAAAPCSCCGK